MLAVPCFDSAFKKKKNGGWGGVSVGFLQFCIAACLIAGTTLSALKMSKFCFFRVVAVDGSR